MKKWLILLVLLSVFPFSCQQKQYQVIIASKDQVTKFNEGKIIDVTAVLDKYKEDVPEFKEGPWAIAVYSYKTSYMYYYDDKNSFLGRKKKDLSL